MPRFYVEVHEDGERIPVPAKHKYPNDARPIDTFEEAKALALSRVDDALRQNRVHVLQDVGYAFCGGDGGDYWQPPEEPSVDELAERLREATGGHGFQINAHFDDPLKPSYTCAWCCQLEHEGTKIITEYRYVSASSMAGAMLAAIEENKKKNAAMLAALKKLDENN